MIQATEQMIYSDSQWIFLGWGPKCPYISCDPSYDKKGAYGEQ